MSKELENLIKKAKEVDSSRYSFRVSELSELARMCGNNFINGSYILFQIGFMKGQRAEKARQKKRQSQTA